MTSLADEDDDLSTSPNSIATAAKNATRSTPSQPASSLQSWLTPALNEWIVVSKLLVAYFAAIGVVVVALGRAGTRIAELLGVNPAAAKATAFGPLILLIFLHALPKYMDRRKRARTYELLKRNHGFRTEALSLADRQSFARPDGIHERVFDWIRQTTHTILYMTGDSGTGKTSLLKANVIPRLEDTGNWTCILIEQAGDVEQTFRNALLGPRRIAAKRPPEHHTLHDLLKDAAVKTPRRRILIVIDNFEDMLVGTSAPSRRRTFIQGLLKELTEAPVAGVTALLVVRHERKHTLANFAGGRVLSPLRQDENWLVVRPFVRADADSFFLDANVRLGDSHEEVFNQIRDIEGGSDLVRPITLNMVGLALVASAVPNKKELIRYSGRAGLLQTYLAESLREADVLGSVRAIIRHLITDERHKVARSVAELARLTRYSAPVVDDVLKNLQQHSLVRCVDEDAGIWEISHNFLARQLDQAVRGWSRTTLESLRRVAVPLSFAAVGSIAAAAMVAPSYHIHRLGQGGETALHAYTMLGDEYAVRHVLKKNPSLVNARTIERRRTPLMIAAFEGNREITKALLQNSANANASTEGETALHIAAFYGKLNVVEELLKPQYSVNVDAEMRGGPPSGHPAADLLGIPNRVNVMERPRYTALHFAAMNGHAMIVKELIRHKATVDVRSGERYFEVGTPLMYAAKNGHVMAAKALIDGKADKLAYLSVNGATVLHFAAESNRPELLDLLGESVKGHVPRGTEDAKHTPLVFAARAGCAATVTELLKPAWGAKADTPAAFGNLPIHFAAESGDVQTIRVLLGALPDPDVRNDADETPLFFAAKSGASAVSYLLAQKASLVCKNKKGEQPIHWASQAGRSEAVRVLLLQARILGREHEVVNAQSNDGIRPIHYAAASGDEETIRVLFSFGVDVDVEDGWFKHKPSRWARYYKHQAVVGLLESKERRQDPQRAPGSN